MPTDFRKRFVSFARNVTNPGAPDPLNAAVDGSVNEVEFEADFNSGFEHAVSMTRFTFVATKPMKANGFGSGNPLDNGIQFVYRQADGFNLDTTFQIFQNGDWGQFFDITMFGEGRGFTAVLNYRDVFGDVAILAKGTQVGFTVNDDLTNRLTMMKVYHFGYKMV